MRVVIITTKEEVYHQYLCADLVKRCNVVAVLHPLWPRLSRQKRLELTRNRIRRYGVPQYLLQKLTSRGLFPRGWDEQHDLAAACRRLIPHAEAEYGKNVAPLARDCEAINSPDGVQLLASLEPDVVVCSGGPIYRAPLIEAARLMLNFHTGISPIYNGARTIYWTYANRQPHLTGGTLMVMSPIIDGGDILGHYLPAVEPGDTPGMQFVKTIMGGVGMYARFLEALAADTPYVTLPQGKPFRMYYEDEWTPFQSLAVQRYIAADICAKFPRPERVHEYWRRPDRATAEADLKATLLGMVYHP